MERRNLFNKIFGFIKSDRVSQRYELLSDSSGNFFPWSGNAFDNDLVRAAIRPKVNAVGRLNAKHIRGEGSGLVINPDPRIKAILRQPNPYMSMQDFLMKMVYQRELEHNAFAYVKRDPNFFPVEIWPIPFSNVDLKEVDGEMFVKFWFKVGKSVTVPYRDVIHLRKDFNNNDIFGESGYKALKNIMGVIDTTDQGIVNAVKSSAIIKWLMLFKQTVRPEDAQKEIDLFVTNYLDPKTAKGVAPADQKYDLKQIEPKNYVPNAAQTDRMVERLNSYYGVNENIKQNKYTEDEWNAFYEAEIELIVIQLSNAFTGAFFTAREIGFTNRIIFEANNLQYASMQTKLNLMQMVDRGSLTPNEWRAIMNLGPVEGGDEPIRRLDTAPVDKTGKDEDNGNTDEGGQDDGNNKQPTRKD